MPRASLVYLTYNSSSDISHLPNLVGHAGEELPVIAIDNASRDDSAVKLAALGLEPQVLDENLGFTAGINVGLLRLVEHNVACPEDKVEWAIIANPDVRVQEKDWLTRLLEVEDSVGVVGARLTNGMSVLGGGVVRRGESAIRRPSARPVDGGSLLCDELIGWTRVTQLHGDPSSFTETRDVAWVAFALCAIRLSMVAQIGLLDETYWHYVSDHEYCLRAWAHGWSVRYQPVTFWHPSNTALKTAPPEVEEFVRQDIRRWCRVEADYLRASQWA